MPKLFFERSLVSFWRLIPVLVIVLFMSAIDLYYVDALGVETTGDLVRRTITFTAGGYAGFTIAAYAVAPRDE